MWNEIENLNKCVFCFEVGGKYLYMIGLVRDNLGVIVIFVNDVIYINSEKFKLKVIWVWI